MRVCMIVHQDYHRDGRVRRYAEALAEAGVEVDVLAVEPATHSDQQAPPGIQVHTIPVSRGYGGLRSYVREYLVALWHYTWLLLRLYFRRHYEVIHVHNMPDFLVFAALIPRLFGAKLILDVHDAMPEFFMSKYQKPADSRLAQILRWQERLSAGLAHAVITANHNFRRNLIKRGIAESKLTVVHNVPDLKIFDRARHAHIEKEARFTLLYPGTLAPRYGLDIAICAMPTLKQQIPDVLLRIIGPQVEYVEELKALVESLAVGDCVEILPAVPIEEVPAAMAQAQVGFYTAIPDAHMDIATPSKVMEFAVMGLPIVGARITVLKDMFAEDALLFFEPGNVAEFAAQVVRLYEEPALRQRLVERMDATFLTTHTWVNECDRYFAVLARLVPGQPLAQPQAHPQG